MLRVALRAVVAVFAETEKVEVPLPVTVELLVRVIQVGSPLTPQEQLAEVVILTLAVPPEAGTVVPGAESEYVQGVGSWDTAKVWSAMLTVALRGDVEVLG